MVWPGAGSAGGSESMVDNLIFFDDNYVSSSLAPSESSKFDHYALEWFEIYDDNTFAAVLTERRVVCLWPQANIASQVITVGNPKGATISSNCANLITPNSCTQCSVNEPWCRIEAEFNNIPEIEGLVSFGGLQWEAIRHIVAIEQQVTPSGFTGAIGNNATFFQATRLSSPSVSLGDLSSAPSYSPSSALGVAQSMRSFSAKVEDWSQMGLISLESEAANRRNLLLGTRRTPAHNESVCCSAVDLDYLEDNTCDDQTIYCCKTEIEGWFCGTKIIWNGMEMIGEAPIEICIETYEVKECGSLTCPRPS